MASKLFGSVSVNLLSSYLDLSRVEADTGIAGKRGDFGIEATGDMLDADDVSRIKVWNVADVVDSENDYGVVMHTPFTCRAYVLDRDLVHAIVLLDHHH